MTDNKTMKNSLDFTNKKIASKIVQGFCYTKKMAPLKCFSLLVIKATLGNPL